ncbi:MAG: HAMP domain-containing histidine kinase [Vicinamibacteria bacterium]|nr:HAMP domain-containing histidine kinase [Vicinamibacteria bacterium]
MSRHRRLFHRIYFSLLLVALLSVAASGLASFHFLGGHSGSPMSERLTAEAVLIARALPEDGRSRDEVLATMRQAAGSLHLDAALFDAHGRLIAATSDDMAKTRARLLAGRIRRTALGPVRTLTLEDGRRLAVRPIRAPRHGVLMLIALTMLVVALAAGCHPVARRLTRRLEALERGVERLGSGELDARVTVEGKDEIARLAERFNTAADKIERLVVAQRRVLASASHELRSPLSRLRLALELIREEAGDVVDRRVEDAVGEIGELDDLIEDILLSSRLETRVVSGPIENVELIAILESEAARVGARVESTRSSVPIAGESRMLRRLIRNLLENAKRYGRGSDITVGVDAIDDDERGARLWIVDRGPGIAPEERERVFEPFYRAARHREGEDGGVGLGLSLVRQIAEHHGGAASCREREGGGAVFEVMLRDARVD